MQDMIEALKTALEPDASLFEGGELLKNAVIERALRMDPALLEMLTASDTIREHFFIEVNGALIFDKVAFQRFVSNKAFLPDSYTAFKNRIGLMRGDDYLKQSRDVVLAWPYKDCVLEGGMTREDRGRQEVFWNETLAPDDVSRLFEPKVLTNFRRWDAEAVAAGAPKPVDEIREEDNLLIKGNNLLALHTLKARYAGKVKLIYIDPPYNTGNDGFKYNDRFNHASWLTFMKNRLEVAKDLLTKDGAIFVNLDDGEVHYAKILLDEIFGRENFIFQATIQRSAPTGHKSINPTPVQVADYVLVFAKNRSTFNYKPQYVSRDYDTAYNTYIKNYDDGPHAWQFESLQKALKELDLTIEEAIKNFPEKIIRFAQPSYDGVGKQTRELIDKSKQNPDHIYIQKRDENSDIYLKAGNRILFYKDKVREIDGQLSTSELMTNIWTDIKFQGIAKEGGIVMTKGKKPERLIRRILNVCTNPGDIVLDFFSGSGTTAAVAHKMDRRWINVEQMDYIDDLNLPRLKAVIKGEQGGISKIAEWSGGGSFIRTDLLTWNETLVTRIRDASSIEDLITVREDMLANGYLRHDLNRDELAAATFPTSLEDAQDLLIGCLDMNHLFVNFGEMGDPAYGVSEDEQRLNRSFQEKT